MKVQGFVIFSVGLFLIFLVAIVCTKFRVTKGDVNEEVDVRDGDDIIAVASPYAECKDKEASITFGLARVFCTGENLPPPYVLTGFDTKFGDTGLCFCFFVSPDVTCRNH